MTTTPRPILKTRPILSAGQCFPSPATALPSFKYPISPHVHFPPTPTLTDTQVTHSPFVYDRAPIVVSPNACRLPERGGRNYSSFTPPSEGGYFDFRSPSSRWDHPLHAPEHEQPPPLVHDSHSSSESEESDTCTASPVHTCPDEDVHHRHDRDTICILTPSRALSFLPHPHDSEARPPQRPKPKRKQTGPQTRPPVLNVKDDTFSTNIELSLDGCLGGF
ncbi:hypothetical protein H0H87_007261 [Tephrocybe sp. NHM501043]|nr:hypothetical protein H0H87_007261 [Tephrocybe sp. NHM501043]